MAWKVLETLKLFESKMFSFYQEKCQLPDGRIMPKYFKLGFSDWVNVVPLTSNKEIITIWQYRHGIGDYFWEVPGGSTHPGGQEDPLLAAQRELLEETGYVSDEWQYVGYHHPNPALLTNKMHTYVAHNCKYQQPPQLDPYEDLSVKLQSIEDVYKLLAAGKIQHSLMIASLALARPYL